MKKLLSILAAVTLTATASTSVVACGSSSTDSENNLTKNIIDGGILGSVSASDIINNILKTGNQSLIFGDQGTALKTFLNYASESFMENSGKLKDISDKYIKTGLASSDETVKAKAQAAASYIDDGLWDSIKQDWTTRHQNAEDAWDQAKKDATSKYGKQWEDSWFKDLQSQFGDYVYGSNGNKTKATSYDQYKDLYISYSELNGDSNGKSIADSLKDDIYLWGTSPDGTLVKTIKTALMNQVFTATPKIKIDPTTATTIDFKSNSKQLSSDDAKDSSKWKGTWLGEMKNFISALNDAATKAKGADKLTGDNKTFMDDLIDMINATGGTNLETQIAKDGKPNIHKYMIGKAEWASESNIQDVIKNWPADGAGAGIESMAKDLIQRWDANFDKDFNGTKATGKTNVSNLVVNADYDVKMTSVYSNPGKTTTTPVNGLFSNAQRYAANDYYNTEKPVAVSELVVKPLYSDGPGMDQSITNNKYVGKDGNGNTGLMDSFYRFLGNFIDNGLKGADGKDGTFSAANTTNVADGTSQYSWDDLIKSKITGVNDVTTSSPFDSGFTGNVSFTSHSNLLTRDSSSSDYSDLLKYSVYDYLQNGMVADKNDLTDLNKDSKLTNPQNIDQNTLDQEITSSADAKDKVNNEYTVITNLVNNLNRTKAAQSVYKVVNAQQGIIAFADKDGIHFVRIEGYGLLDKDGKGAKASIGSAVTTNRPSQGKLSVNDFSSKTDNVANNAQDSYYSAQLLADDLGSDTKKDYATNITTDYMNSSDYDATTHDKITNDEFYSGLRYDDLNKNFGNTYLRFLANSSIAKSNGGTGKYDFDLNSEVKSYIGADLTEDNLADTSNLLDMVWSYIETITGMTDDDLWEFVSTNGAKTSQSNSLLFDVLRNTQLDDNSTDRFVKLYEEWIKSALDANSKLNRDTKGAENFMEAWGKADKTLATGTVWTNQDTSLDDYRPTLTFKDADGGSTNDDYYSDMAESIDEHNIWIPYAKTTIYDSGSSSDDKQPKNIFYSEKASSETRYQVKLSEFMPNSHAVKGDEE